LQSGVRNLLLVLASALAVLSAGQLVTKTQRPAPIIVFTSALAAVACGLFYIFDEGTSTGKWIGYQILGGFAWGGGFQMAINTAQAKADPAHLLTVISTNFYQSFITLPDGEPKKSSPSIEE
jgi:cyanate permease